MIFSQSERIRKIHDRIKQRGQNGATTKELIDICQSSRSTFMEDKAHLKDILGAPIKYSRKNKSYYYYEDFELSNDLMLSRQEFNKIRLAFKTLSQLKNIEAYQDLEGVFYKLEKAFNFQKNYQRSSFIHFEKVPFYKGTEHINFFLEAIEFTKEVSFDYHSFKSNNIINHVFQPYVIKEHTNRWYVIGFNPNEKSTSTFALDRMKGNFTFTNLYYKIPTSFQLDNYHRNVIGLTVYDNKPIQEIKLQFTPLQAQYFLSKPFHQFETIKHDENKLIIKMDLIPNYELIQKLASFGSGVKILSPENLIHDFKSFMRKTLQLYS
ncbi:MAG: helix-turn-helix transcriptional regulator [Saprospiraceae bacterium]